MLAYIYLISACTIILIPIIALVVWALSLLTILIHFNWLAVIIISFVLSMIIAVAYNGKYSFWNK